MALQGHVVKGHVLEGMMHYKDAAEVYRKGLELEPGHPDMKEGVKRAENKQSMLHVYCMCRFMCFCHCCGSKCVHWDSIHVYCIYTTRPPSKGGHYI